MWPTLLRRLTTTGLRRGMAGSRPWLAIAIVAGAVRLLRRATRNEEDILYRTAVRAGDVFEIVTKPGD